MGIKYNIQDRKLQLFAHVMGMNEDSYIKKDHSLGKPRKAKYEVLMVNIKMLILTEEMIKD